MQGSRVFKPPQVRRLFLWFLDTKTRCVTLLLLSDEKEGMLRYVATLTPCPNDAVVKISVPKSVASSNKYSERAFFLLYEEESALRVHIMLEKNRSARDYANRTVIGFVSREVITGKAGRQQHVLLVVPTRHERVNARVELLETGEFAVKPL